MFRGGLLEYIRVEGQIDHDGPVDLPVKGLVFRGLTFTEGARYTYPPDYKGGRWQHDWAGYDEASALLRFRGAEDCLVEKCRFVNSGASGVRLDLYAQNITMRENEFAYLGESGVIISGYGPGSKDVNFGNTIENNWFHHGAEHHWHASAILVAQSGGNRIRHNMIHDYNYNGITVTGLRRLIPNANYGEQRAESQKTVRWHEVDRQDFMEFPETISFMYGKENLIEGNEIFRIMERLGDGNAIYLSCAGEGNIVRSNYVHHIRGDAASALRSDDAQYNVLYENNVIYRTTGHGIILKGPNQALNNFIIDQQEHFETKVPGTIYIAVRTGPFEGVRIERNIYAQFDALEPAFYYLTKPTKDKYSNVVLDEIENATIDRNLFWSEHNPPAAKKALADVQWDYEFGRNSRVGNPQFIDVENGDFRLKPDSPALAMGIEPIDVSVAGLQGDFREQVVRPSAGRVTIRPDSRIFTGPVTVEMEVGSSQSKIHYTLDGSEPTEISPLYRQPLVVDRPLTVRARAFRDGAVDRLGTRVDFHPSTQPIFETFEKESDGRSRSRMRFGGNAVSLKEDPSGAGRGTVLCFDDPGSGNRFQPLGYYQVVHGRRDVEISFDLWIGRDAEMLLQWTPDPNAGPGSDPCIIVRSNGSVVSPSDGVVLGEINPEEWNEITVRLPLGGRDDMDPELLINGRESRAFENSQASRRYNHLEKIMFCSSSVRPSKLYLDNISIQPISDDL